MRNMSIDKTFKERAKREENRLTHKQFGHYIYRVSLGNSQEIYHVEDVTSKSPSEALYEVLKKQYDLTVYAVDFYELKHRLDINRIANAKVEKLTGIRITAHYYRVDVDTVENKRARREAQLKINRQERRGHYQNIV